MSHSLIHLNNLTLYFPQKVCFEGFHAELSYGQRIGLIGGNGSGKSSLLKIIQGEEDPTSGTIVRPPDLICGYVPQVITSCFVEQENLSGGELFQKALTRALAQDPNLLLLDEPTNHLDQRNRDSLRRLLSSYPGTLLIASHDVTLLREEVKTLWHIDQGKIQVFSGDYEDYQREIRCKRQGIEESLTRLERQKKESHATLMKEQERAKKSRLKGEKHIAQRKWPTIVSDEKARRALETSGRKKKQIRTQKEELSQQLATLRLPEILRPTFHFKDPFSQSCRNPLFSIVDGVVGYDTPLLQDLHLSLEKGERMALTGDNGSGKSTLIKALLGKPNLIHGGDWYLPKGGEVGYLDQHYNTLDPSKTVFETIETLQTEWTAGMIRQHLNDFLFRKNEEVQALTTTLSGGERARLSLAQLAAAAPNLLILDEASNNLDLEVLTHLIQVLNLYSGGLLVISHDRYFLGQIGITTEYRLSQGILKRV